MGKFEKTLFQAQRGLCFVCEKEMPSLKRDGVLPRSKGGRLLIDREHVTPKSLGGPLGFPNLVLAHRDCNREKDSRLPTPEELARLGAVNSKIERSDIVAAATEHIETLYFDNSVANFHRRKKAVEFLSSTLGELTREELDDVFRQARVVSAIAAPTNAVAATPTSNLNIAQTATAGTPSLTHVGKGETVPDPVGASVATSRGHQPMIMAAMFAMIGLAVSISVIFAGLGFTGAESSSITISASTIIPVFVIAGLVAGLTFRRSTSALVATLALTLSICAALVEFTPLDGVLRAVLTDLANRAGLSVGRIQPSIASALALSCVAWLALVVAALANKAPERQTFSA